MPSYGLPIDQINIDELPEEESLDYAEISRLVGSLYIDYHHKINMIQKRAKAIIDKLKNRIDELSTENIRLKEQLKKEHIDETGPID